MASRATTPASLSSAEAARQIAALRKSIPVASLSPSKRRSLRDNNRVSPDVLDAELDLIANSKLIETSLHVTREEARQKLADARRWKEVERDLSALLAGVTDQNLVRLEEINQLGAQAYALASSLARTPAGRNLASLVIEIRKVRNAGRKKRSAKKS